jgi:hypothetical protein
MNRIRAAALFALTGLAFLSGCMSNPCSNPCSNGGGFLQRLGFGSRRQCCPETCCPSACCPSCGGGCCGEGFGEGPMLGDPNGPFIMQGPMQGPMPGGAPVMQDLGQPRILPQPAQPTPAPPEMTSRIKPR